MLSFDEPDPMSNGLNILSPTQLLQDKTVGAGVGTLADGVERLPEPILDDSFLPPDARFPQVRLLPNDVGHRRSPPGRRSRAGKHLHGCA